MKNKYIFKLLILICSFQVAFGQMDTRATLEASGNTVTVYAKPFTAPITFPNTSNVIAINLAVSLPANGAVNPSLAPAVLNSSTLSGLGINSSIPIQIINDRFVYTFIISGNVGVLTAWGVDSENLIFTMSFGAGSGDKFPRLDNLIFATAQSYFYFEVNSITRSDTEGTPFYDGALGSYNPNESYVESLTPLPITLKSFDARKHSASSAKLDWTTSKEVNSDYFGIERSIDGSTWDEISRVKAAGESNVDIAYDYIDDRLPLSRTNGQVFYYRLRMTDLDGAFKYSDVRGVNFDKQALGPISIYPNPTTEIVNIDLSEVAMEDGDVYVSVYDMSGRLVMTKQIIGSGIELIKVDQLPSDAYNFIIRQGEQIHQQRVIKID